MQFHSDRRMSLADAELPLSDHNVPAVVLRSSRWPPCNHEPRTLISRLTCTCCSAPHCHPLALPVRKKSTSSWVHNWDFWVGVGRTWESHGSLNETQPIGKDKRCAPMILSQHFTSIESYLLNSSSIIMIFLDLHHALLGKYLIYGQS